MGSGRGTAARQDAPPDRSSGNESWLSHASVWELAIKASLGKLRLDRAVERFVAEHSESDGFRPLLTRRYAPRLAAVALEPQDGNRFPYSLSIDEAMPQCAAGLASALNYE